MDPRYSCRGTVPSWAWWPFPSACAGGGEPLSCGGQEVSGAALAAPECGPGPSVCPSALRVGHLAPRRDQKQDMAVQRSLWRRRQLHVAEQLAFSPRPHASTFHAACSLLTCSSQCLCEPTSAQSYPSSACGDPAPAAPLLPRPPDSSVEGPASGPGWGAPSQKTKLPPRAQGFRRCTGPTRSLTKNGASPVGSPDSAHEKQAHSEDIPLPLVGHSWPGPPILWSFQGVALTSEVALVWPQECVAWPSLLQPPGGPLVPLILTPPLLPKLHRHMHCKACSRPQVCTLVYVVKTSPSFVISFASRALVWTVVCMNRVLTVVRGLSCM